MEKVKTVFQRTEKKYLLDPWQYVDFLEGMADYMEEDVHGLHTICNLYYDTEDFLLIRRSLEKPKYKEKLRLRSYGVPKLQDTVFVEIKKKYQGIVYKRRVEMTLQEAQRYLNQGMQPQKENQVLHEIDYFIEFYKPMPQMYIGYDRIAYFGKEDEELRITFDKNIRSREDELSLESGDFGRLLLQQETYLMEVKLSGAMPLWMARLLSQLKIYPTSFSKYGRVYERELREGFGLERRNA